MKKLNIFQLYDYMELGGAESHIITLSKSLMELGHNVSIASSFGPAVNTLKRLSIPFYEIERPDESTLMSNAGKLLEIVDRLKIDIIHSHPFQSQVLDSLIKLIREIPVVTTIHGSYNTPSVSGLENFIDHYIFISPETLRFHYDNFIFMKNKNYQMIPNCVEVCEDVQIELNTKQLTITYISRLDNDKLPSIKFFINSIEVLAKKHDIKVFIIGKGKKYNNILNKAKLINNRLSKQVIQVINGSDNIIQHIIKSDIIVGVGRVILEAISLGKVAICVGNNNYVGIVNKNNLEKIAEVNYTDRNTDIPLETDKFVEDIEKIIEKPELIKQDVKEVHELIKIKNNVKFSAKEHEKIYLKLVREHQKKFEINDLEKYRTNSKFVDDIVKTYELRNDGLNYHLDTRKANKILLKPDFNNKNDMWIEKLTYLVKNIDFKKNTIVFRIGNEFLDQLELIIEKLENVYTTVQKFVEPDLLIDFYYHDEVTENLFLQEMDCFVPTNDNQHNIIYKFTLFGGKVLN